MATTVCRLSDISGSFISNQSILLLLFFFFSIIVLSLFFLSLFQLASVPICCFYAGGVRCHFPFFSFFQSQLLVQRRRLYCVDLTPPSPIFPDLFRDFFVFSHIWRMKISREYPRQHLIATPLIVTACLRYGTLSALFFLLHFPLLLLNPTTFFSCSTLDFFFIIIGTAPSFSQGGLFLFFF